MTEARLSETRVGRTRWSSPQAVTNGLQNVTSSSLCLREGAFNGGYTQSAGALVLNGGRVSASAPLDINGGSVTGSGTINASIANGGDLSPGA